MNKIIIEDLERILNQPVPWRLLKNKTVLVTGASGFISTYFIEMLFYLNNKKGYDIKVIALVRDKKFAVARFSQHLSDPNFKLLVQDVCKQINIKNNIDYIIHAASQASPKIYGKDPVGTLSANILGTINTLELAKKNKTIGYLFLSSGEIYGEVDNKMIPTKETDYGYLDPINLRSCYAESKRMGENMCVSWSHQYFVPAKIARLFHTYGPGMKLKDGRVFADFVSNIVHNENIVLNSDGSAKRTFCYLSDTVTACFLILLKGKNGEVYNLGQEKETSIIDLANLLIGMFPEKKLKVIRKENISAEGYIKSTISRACPDVSKLRKLGWKPIVDIKTGFKRTIISY